MTTFFSSPDLATEHAKPNTVWKGSDSDSTAGFAFKKRGTPPRKKAIPAKYATSARLPSPITPKELRALAGDKSAYSENARYGFAAIASWLAGDTTKETAHARRRIASSLGTDIAQGKKSLEYVLGTLFEKIAPELMLRKAKLMTAILEIRPLDPRVREFAVAHVSSRCTPSHENLIIAGQYLATLKAQKPNIETFESDHDTWWPTFAAA